MLKATGFTHHLNDMIHATMWLMCVLEMEDVACECFLIIYIPLEQFQEVPNILQNGILLGDA